MSVMDKVYQLVYNTFVADLTPLAIGEGPELVTRPAQPNRLVMSRETYMRIAQYNPEAIGNPATGDHTVIGVPVAFDHRMPLGAVQAGEMYGDVT